MGIQDLQEFIETHCQQACKPVDLFELSRMVSSSKTARRRGGRLRLLVDADSCLDRLYGGFYSDWACGGEWQRMFIFLRNLFSACHNANLELFVYVNGALERERLTEWYSQQMKLRHNAHKVLKHAHTKGTPPPKVWWIAPACLNTALRLTLQALDVPMATSMDEHHQEIIACCRENSYNGIIAQNADFAVFDPPRYFSAQNLKLTYKGTLETQEYVIDDVAKTIDLNPKRFSVLAALLGTHLLPVEDLQDFYCIICEQSFPAQVSKLQAGTIVRAVINFVRSVESVDNLDDLGAQIFRNSLGNVAGKIERFRQSVHYYLNGTKDGFLKYFPKNKQAVQDSSQVQPGSYAAKSNKKTRKKELCDKKESRDDEVSNFTADSSYADLRSGYGDGPQPSSDGADSEKSAASVNDNSLPGKYEQPDTDSNTSMEKLDVKMAAVSLSQEEQADIAAVQTEEDEASSRSKTAKDSIKDDEKNKKQNSGRRDNRCPQVPQQVLSIAAERHYQGRMHPYIYQVLSQGEVKLGQCLEDENEPDLPYSIDVFRLMRQHVYAILFDLSKQLAEYNRRKKDKTGTEKKMDRPRVSVREWVIPKLATSGGARCDTIQAEPVDWLVSGIQRLWLGSTGDDKNRRLRAFMSCMHCDLPQNLLMDTSYVPQNFLILCCVLRYIILYKAQRILLRHELDAFLATAVSRHLSDADYIQEMKLASVEPRGLQLASLFMTGVDHAVFVNDAVGAPIPWTLCLPWLFFDGKLFHYKYTKACNHCSLLDLCDGYSEEAMRVEQMRTAILQGCSPGLVFARPSLSHSTPFLQHSSQQHTQMYTDVNFIPAGAHVGSRGQHYPQQHMPVGRGIGRGRGLLGQGPSERRGGQLQIAGVVVGNWGANHHQQQHHQQHLPGYYDVVGQGGGRRKGRGKGPSPQVVNIGSSDQRRGARTQGRNPKIFQMPSKQNNNNNGLQRGRGRKFHTTASVAHDLTEITLEEKTRGNNGGRGRGSTIESSSEEGATVSILNAGSQLSSADKAVFEDAENDTSLQTDAPVMSAKTALPVTFQDVNTAPQNGLNVLPAEGIN